MNDLGAQIKRLRTKKGITQSELADVIGVSVQAVSKWECGGTPDISLIPSIADFFQVRIDSLFGRQSINEISLEEYIFRHLQSIPDDEKMSRATNVCWAAFKGIAGMSNISNLHYTNHENRDDDICTRCSLSFDDGIAYANAKRGEVSILLFPEPDEGFSSVIGCNQELLSLFELLANSDFLNATIFLCSCNRAPFSLSHIAKELATTTKSMQNVLNQMSDLGWLTPEEVYLESGLQVIYRPNLSTSIIPFLFYATEILSNIKLWYISHDTRVKPLLRNHPTKNKSTTR